MNRSAHRTPRSAPPTRAIVYASTRVEPVELDHPLNAALDAIRAAYQAEWPEITSTKIVSNDNAASAASMRATP